MKNFADGLTFILWLSLCISVAATLLMVALVQAVLFVFRAIVPGNRIFFPAPRFAK